MLGLSNTDLQGRPFVLVYLAVVFLGIAMLFPWNAYLKAGGYLGYVLAGSRFEASFPSYVSFAYTISTLVTMICLVVFKVDKIQIGKREKPWLNTSQKVFVGLFGNLALIGAVALFPTLNLIKGKLSIGPNAFFALLLSIISITGVFASVLMNGLYEMISVLPSKFTPALLGGQATVGAFLSLVSLIAALLSAASNNASSTAVVKGAVFYFSMAFLTLLCSFGGYLWLRGTSLYHERVGQLEKGSEGAEVDPKGAPSRPLGLIEVFRFIPDLALGVFGTLFTTIALIASYIPSVKSRATNVDSLWAKCFLSIVFLSYDFGDLVGRWLPSFSPFTFRRRSRWPALLPWIRLLIFLPLFMFSDMHGVSDSFRKIVPIVVRHDSLYLILVFLFGVSSGYCCTLLMMLCPERSTRRFVQVNLNGTEGVDQCRARAGSIMGLFINSGLVAGALASFGLRYIAAGSL